MTDLLQERNIGKDRKRALQSIRLLVSAGLLGVVLWVVPIGDVARAVLNVQFSPFLLGLLFSLVAAVVTAIELWTLTRYQGIQHDVGQILAINLSIKFYSLISPSSLVGSGIRLYRLSSPGGKVAEAISASAFFRLLEIFLTILFALGFLLISDFNRFANDVFPYVILLFLITLTSVVLVFASEKIYRSIKSKLAPNGYNHNSISRIEHLLEKTLAAISSFAKMPVRMLLLAFGAGAASDMLGIASGFFIAQSVGISIPFSQMGWINASTVLVTQLPITVAGGLGLREITLMGLFSSLGIDPEVILAFSFLLFARGALIGILGGFLEIVRGLADSPKTKSGNVDRK